PAPGRVAWCTGRDGRAKWIQATGNSLAGLTCGLRATRSGGGAGLSRAALVAFFGGHSTVASTVSPGNRKPEASVNNSASILKQAMKNKNCTTALVLSAIASSIAGNAWAQDWPQWRGPDRDGKASAFTAPKTWPKELTQKWKVTVGDGVATP